MAQQVSAKKQQGMSLKSGLCDGLETDARQSFRLNIQTTKRRFKPLPKRLVM